MLVYVVIKNNKEKNYNKCIAARFVKNSHTILSCFVFLLTMQTNSCYQKIVNFLWNCA